MNILKYHKHCLLCSIALIQFKILLLNCCTSLIICCLITLNEMLTWGKIQLCTHNQSWDMDILNFVFYSSNACKNQN